jgi:hypothetical protein
LKDETLELLFDAALNKVRVGCSASIDVVEGHEHVSVFLGDRHLSFCILYYDFFFIGEFWASFKLFSLLNWELHNEIPFGDLRLIINLLVFNTLLLEVFPDCSENKLAAPFSFELIHGLVSWFVISVL